LAEQHGAEFGLLKLGSGAGHGLAVVGQRINHAPRAAGVG